MATVKEHYQNLLADIYSWMYGGFDCAVTQNQDFFTKHKVKPHLSKIAIDLGAGCGFQSIPLAQLGFSVVAIDSNSQLLSELLKNADSLNIDIVEGDLIDCDRHISDRAELVVCMTDTLLHLESKEKVIALFDRISNLLDNQGKFILTFRDLTVELSELKRFIPVRSDADRIFTCCLEYESETVKVHDLVYQLKQDKWVLHKSFYRKLRLSQTWVEEQLQQANFENIESNCDRGLITIIATK